MPHLVRIGALGRAQSDRRAHAAGARNLGDRACEAFDQRQSGWIKVELLPKAA
jgi:hypothetical protein